MLSSTTLSENYLSTQSLVRGFQFKQVNEIPDMWDLIRKSVNHIHPTSLDYDDKTEKSTEEKLFASDMVNFRLGPALLYQFRRRCGNYNFQWKENPGHNFINSTSPLKTPWRETFVPAEWKYFTSEILKNKICGYETRLDETRVGANFIISFLEKQRWIDKDS